MDIITAWPFSSRRGEDRVLKTHRVLLTFPLHLSIKRPPVKRAGFVVAQHSCWLGEPAELLKGTATCEEVPHLKDTRRKIFQLPPSVKVSRQIPSLVHNFSPHPGSTDPSQPSKTPTRTASWQSVGLYPGREAGASVTEDFSGTLHHSGTVGLLQARLRQLVRTKGLHFH